MAKRFTIEVVKALEGQDQGKLLARLAGQKVHIDFHNKGSLTRIFVSSITGLSEEKAFFEFSGFLRETAVIPYNIRISLQTRSRDPNETEKGIRNAVDSLSGFLSDLVKRDIQISPEIWDQGSGALCGRFSMTLDNQGYKGLTSWASRAPVQTEIEQAPFQEKNPAI